MASLQMDIYRVVSALFLVMGVAHLALLIMIYFNTVPAKKATKVKSLLVKHEGLALFVLGVGLGFFIKTVIG